MLDPFVGFRRRPPRACLAVHFRKEIRRAQLFSVSSRVFFPCVFVADDTGKLAHVYFWNHVSCRLRYLERRKGQKAGQHGRLGISSPETRLNSLLLHSPIIFTSTRLSHIPLNSPQKICPHVPKSKLPFITVTSHRFKRWLGIKPL
jgi:hypothetical protein